MIKGKWPMPQLQPRPLGTGHQCRNSRFWLEYLPWQCFLPPSRGSPHSAFSQHSSCGKTTSESEFCRKKKARKQNGTRTPAFVPVAVRVHAKSTISGLEFRALVLGRRVFRYRPRFLLGFLFQKRRVKNRKGKNKTNKRDSGTCPLVALLFEQSLLGDLGKRFGQLF